MKKKILAIIISLVAINSSFAATGYRVYDEEIHSAPGFQLHVEHLAPGTAKAMAEKKSMMSGRTRTSVPSRSGRVNQSITVDGYHDFSIYNSTNRVQTYELYSELNCHNLRSYYRRHVDVYPNGSFSNNDHTFGTVQESYAGNYRIEAETRQSGESSDSSRDSNTLSVSR